MEILSSLISPAGYVETHYRPGGFLPSRYFSSMPEIQADAPAHLLPGRDIPVAVIIKDSNLYPAVLLGVSFVDAEGNVLSGSTETAELTSPMFYRLFHLDRSLFSGEYAVFDVRITLKLRGREVTVENSSLKGLPAEPLKVRLLREELPSVDGLYYSDMHHHSEYTWDQIEYGAPVEIIAAFAKAAGIAFQPVTDHSYDLDRPLHEMEGRDPSLPRWHALKKDVEKYSGDELILCRGEELSCGNSQSQNVHMLVIGNSEFITGRGDAGDKPFRNRADISAEDAAELVKGPAVCIAAHPWQHIPAAERMLLNRGSWDRPAPNFISGLQILNGLKDHGFWTGKKEWISGLLRGVRNFIYAGNDAHGNYNIYRQIKFPLVSLKQNRDRLYARCRTGIFAEEFTESALLKAVSEGRCFITDGPLLALGYLNEDGRFITAMGGKQAADEHALILYFRCTEDCFYDGRISVFGGAVGNPAEKLLREFYTGGEMIRTYDIIPALMKGCDYIRAELEDGSALAMTNPVWITDRSEPADCR